MRLVAAPDGTVDRYDRAIWLSLPFDVSWEPEAPPTTEGIEFTLPSNRLHYTLEDGRLHYTVPTNRLHYTVTEEGTR